jgi:hypothetical protein
MTRKPLPKIQASGVARACRRSRRRPVSTIVMMRRPRFIADGQFRRALRRAGASPGEHPAAGVRGRLRQARGPNSPDRPVGISSRSTTTFRLSRRRLRMTTFGSPACNMSDILRKNSIRTKTERSLRPSGHNNIRSLVVADRRIATRGTGRSMVSRFRSGGVLLRRAIVRQPRCLGPARRR